MYNSSSLGQPRVLNSSNGNNHNLFPERVLIYAMNYTPELTGCGRYTGEIGQYLAGGGSAIEVVTTPPHYPGWRVRDGYKAGKYSAESLGNIRVYRCPIGLSQNMKGLGRAWASISFVLSSAPIVFWRIISFKPTHILCIEPTLFASPTALIGAKLIGAKSTLHVQDLEIDAAFAVGHVKGKILKYIVNLFEQNTLKMYDNIVTISNKMRLKLAKKGIREGKISIVRNWVDTKRIYPLYGENKFRKQLGIGESQFVALYAGNIGVKQALNIVADAAEELKSNPNIIFVIAGDGPEKQGLINRNLPNLKFLPLQPEEHLNELLALANVNLLPQDKGAEDLVLPSKLGGMLACGRDILAMADEGSEVYEFLQGAAYLVPQGNSDGLVSVLESLSAGIRAEMVEGSRERALNSLLCDENLRDFVRRMEGVNP